jgi:hypothetical protein
MTEFTREHARTNIKAVCNCGRCLSCQIADEVRARRQDEHAQALSYIAPEDARRIGITSDDKAILREHNAQRHCHEEQLEIRRQKEDKAFADALRRYTEMQQRTVWQRIKALFGRGE